jgi:hypothetical protein
MVSILTEQNVQASIALLKPTDLLISPELGNYTTADFDALAKIAALGEPAAEKVAGRLKELSLAACGLRRPAASARPWPSRPICESIDEIRVVDLKRVNPETVIADMETVAGKPINQEALDRDMRRIYGTGDFEHVNYTLIDEPGRAGTRGRCGGKDHGAPTTSASASVCPATSAASLRSSTWRPATARPGSTRWAPPGETWCSSGSTTWWPASSTSHSTPRASTSSRRPSAI